MPNTSFREHPLSNADRIWLNEAAKPGFDQRVARVRLIDQLPKDFDPNRIDPRLYANGRLSLIGLWHVDRTSELFSIIDQAVKAVRELIKKDPTVTTLTAKDIAVQAGLSEDRVGEALYRVTQYGSFYSSASISNERLTSLSLSGSTGEVALNTYLRYSSLDEMLETYYRAVERSWVVHSHNHVGGHSPAKSPLRRFLQGAWQPIYEWWYGKLPKLAITDDGLSFNYSLRRPARERIRELTTNQIISGVVVAVIAAIIVKLFGLS